jgi:hypothetical protein
MKLTEIPFQPRRVYVVWADPDSDWRWYTLLGFAGAWVHLRGEDAPDGTPFAGPTFWEHSTSIKSMEDVP